MAASPLRSDDPATLGPYRLVGRLGEGGQGMVFLGEAPSGEQVAVKVLKTADPTARARFAREMRAARQVAPFCTAAVLDSSTDGDHPYVVSEYVDGPSLQQRVRESGPLLGGSLVRLAVNTASALAAIHAAGIVHRDLKPANVLLGPDGPRVVDFGIARAMDAETQTQLVGTPTYFAPEWIKGQPPTAKSDVFAWAGTMVYAATGEPPFGTGPTVAAIMHRIAHEEPHLLAVPPALRALLARCLAKDPEQRPTARELIDALVHLNNGQNAPSLTGPARYAPGPPWSRPAAVPTRPGARRRLWRRPGFYLPVSVGVAVASLAAGSFFLLHREDGRTERPTARPTSNPTAQADRYKSPPVGTRWFDTDFVYEAGLTKESREWREDEKTRYTAAGYEYKAATEEGSVQEASHGTVGNILVTTRVRFLSGSSPKSQVGITCHNDSAKKTAVAYQFVLGRNGRVELNKLGDDTNDGLGTAFVPAPGNTFHDLNAMCKTENGALRLVFWVDGAKTIDVLDRRPLPAGASGLCIEPYGSAMAALFARFSVYQV